VFIFNLVVAALLLNCTCRRQHLLYPTLLWNFILRSVRGTVFTLYGAVF